MEESYCRAYLNTCNPCGTTLPVPSSPVALTQDCLICQVYVYEEARSWATSNLCTTAQKHKKEKKNIRNTCLLTQKQYRTGIMHFQLMTAVDDKPCKVQKTQALWLNMTIYCWREINRHHLCLGNTHLVIFLIDYRGWSVRCIYN